MSTTLHESRQALLGTNEDFTPAVAKWCAAQVQKVAITGRPIIDVAAGLEAIHPRIAAAVRAHFASDIYPEEGELRARIECGRVGRSLAVGWHRGRVEFAYLS